MARFLTDSWIECLARAASETRLTGWPGGRLLVEQVVTSEPLVRGTETLHAELGADRGRADGASRSESVRWVLEISDEGVAVSAGGAAGDEPVDLTVVTDRETAVAILEGTLNAQSALAAGSLRVRGDLARIAGLHGALAALGDIFAAVRDSTEIT